MEKILSVFILSSVVLLIFRLMLKKMVRTKTSELSAICEELRLSEQRFRNTFEQAAVGICHLSPEGRFVRVNQSCHEIVGYDGNELLGRHFGEITHPDDLSADSDNIRRILANEVRTFSREKRYVRKDGTVVWANTTVSLVRDSSGEPEYFIAVIRDIRDRKQAEDTLRRHQALLTALIKNLPFDFWARDSENRVIMQSDASISNWGDMSGKKAESTGFGEHLISIWKENNRRAFAGEVVKAEMDYPINGEQRNFHNIVAPIRDNHAILGILGVNIDITERKRAEEAVCRERDFTRYVINSLPGIMYLFDSNGRFLLWNKKFETVSGYSSEEISDLSPEYLFEGNDKALIAESIGKVFDKGEAHVEASFVSKNGASTPYLFTGMRIDSHGQQLLVGMGIDITDRKRAEEERLRLESQLRQAQKMEAVGQLAGGVAHDFNNLLQVIIGYGDMMMGQLRPGEVSHKNMSEIMKSAQRAAALVRQLLLFGRREAMQSKSIDINELVSNLMKMLRRVIGEHIRLEIKPGFALLPVLADPGQIEQVLANLCVNARDAMPDGGRITIETGNVFADSEFCEQHQCSIRGDHVLLTVSDTGCGIPHEIREHIFEPFFTTKDIGKGTGLGLATVYGIVRSHQGMIRVRSEPGQGAAFDIYLPATKTALSSETVEPESPPPVMAGKETILIAEDEDMVRDMIVNVLESSGYRVFSARDGEEAMSLFEKHHAETALAILDVIMPKASGRKVYEHIKAIRPDMPVMFMSGYPRDISKPEFFTDNHCEMIWKPCDPAVLMRKIGEILANAKGSE